MPTESRVTRLHLSSSSAGPRLGCRAEGYAARVTSVGGAAVAATLVATEAALLGGDDLTLSISVDAGLVLELSDAAAMVAYDGRGAEARWTVLIELAAGAQLRWRGEPLIVSDGALVARRLRASLAADAELMLDDTVVLGRHGQAGGRLHCSTWVEREQRPVLVEEVTYDGRPAAQPVQRFVRGASRTVWTRLDTSGHRPVATAGATVLELAGGGTCWRWLG